MSKTTDTTLAEVEQSLQFHLEYLANMDAGIPSEGPTWEDWIRCYEVLAQVKTAQALAEVNLNLNRIATQLEDGRIAVITHRGD